MLRTSATGRQGHSGFTLIELLVVLAILVLAAALFPWAINRALPGQRATAASESIASAVRSAQALSALAGNPVQLILKDDTLRIETGSGVTIPPLRFPAATEVFLQNAARRQVNSMTVYPDGSAQAALFTVTSGNHRSSVSISALTGRVTVDATT